MQDAQLKLVHILYRTTFSYGNSIIYIVQDRQLTSNNQRRSTVVVGRT